MTDLVPPQLVIDSRMLYFGWIPEDKAAVRALLPAEFQPQENSQVFMNQYVVDDDNQTSHFGAYSLTYIGVDIQGLDVNPLVPARWWTHYWTSSEGMGQYAAATGAPATPGGTTTLEQDGNRLVATTFLDGAPLIRTTAKVGSPTGDYVRSHLRYITRQGAGFSTGRYPAIGQMTADLELQSLEFLDKNHPVYDLRPASPLSSPWGFYFPKASFCYPGGLDALAEAEIEAAAAA